VCSSDLLISPNNIDDSKGMSPTSPNTNNFILTSKNNNYSKEPDSVSTNSPAKETCGCNSNPVGKKNMMQSTTDIPSYVFSIGKVNFRFPNKSIEMELLQAIGQKTKGQTKGLNKHEINHSILTDSNYRYITRQLCWILHIENLHAYLLVVQDPLDTDRISQALRPNPDVGDIDVIIARLGPIATPEMCNGLMLPIVIVDQIYSFDRNELLKSIPRKEGMDEAQFKNTSAEIFTHIIQIADNAGATDEHRALNYLAVRYDEIYNRTPLMQYDDYSFTGVEVRQSRLSGSRKVMDVIFNYENQTNRAMQKWFVRIDVTEEFPFLVSPIQQYFKRLFVSNYWLLN